MRRASRIAASTSSASTRSRSLTSNAVEKPFRLGLASSAPAMVRQLRQVAHVQVHAALEVADRTRRARLTLADFLPNVANFAAAGVGGTPIQACDLSGVSAGKRIDA
jgi:hypothetical protein